MQRPRHDEGANGPAHYGPGPRSDPYDGRGGRRDAPLGPEISWPQGFRQQDQSRDVLESGYGTDHVYQQPAMDDYGYGDPGYSDPSYDGPRAPQRRPGTQRPFGSYGQSGSDQSGSGQSGYGQPDPRMSGYQGSERRDSARLGNTGPGNTGPGNTGPGNTGPGYEPQGYQQPQGFQRQDFAAPPAGGQDIYPVTGAQEALPDNGSFTQAGGSAAYPEQWYDHPRLDEAARDPRLEGINYDELRYEEPVTEAPGFNSVDDESWYEELRRNAPAFPNMPDDHPSGPVRRVEPRSPSFGQPSASGPQPQSPFFGPPSQSPASGPQPGYQQAPASDRSGGYGQPRANWGGPGPQLNPGHPTGPGPRTGAPSDRSLSDRSLSDRGPSDRGLSDRGLSDRGPSDRGLSDRGLNDLGTGPRPGNFVTGHPSDPAFTSAHAGPGAGFLGAPVAPVGLLTPPSGTRIESLREGGPQLDTQATTQFLAPTDFDRPRPGTVRPGHGLDGPEITSSWPASPPAQDRDSFAEFWQEDDDDNVEYKGLFGDKDDEDGKTKAKRRIGRRRSGSNDHRLWLALGGVVVLAAGAIAGIIKFEFPSHGGPAHTMTTPAKIGTYARTVDLERQTNVAQLRDEVIKMSAGHASNVVSAVYESGNSAAGNNEQIIMFIGGHLANADPAASVSSFTQKFAGATVVPAGSLGGEAVCVEEAGGTSDSVSMCAWFDNDSFGEIVSPTMNATDLGKAMLTMRPSVEVFVQK